MTTRLSSVRRLTPSTPRAGPRPPASAAVRPSTTALGTAYELATSRTLAQAPFSITGLVNVGGAGDGGVDLRGRWTWSVSTVPGRRGLLHLPNGAAPRDLAGQEQLEPETQSRTWDVVVQCKAEKTAVGPSPVRELEGSVLAELARRHRRPSLATLSSQASETDPAQRLIGILVAMNGFSAAALAHAQTSALPLVMVHLAVGDVDEMVQTRGKQGALLLRSASVNRALRNLITAAFPSSDTS